MVIFIRKFAGLMVFVAICITTYALQEYSITHQLNLSNLFVGDGLLLLTAIRDFVNGIPLENVGPSKGVFLLYALPISTGHMQWVFVTNLAIAIYGVKRFGVGVFLMFPFLLLSLALPSKDLIVTVLTLEWGRALIKGRFGIALAIAALMYVFRDGASIIAAACMLALWLSDRYSSKRMVLAVVVLISVITFSFSLGYLSSFPVFSRVAQVYQMSSHLPCCAPPYYFARVLGNSTNLAFRQMFIDELGGLSALAFTYFVSGVFIIQALLLASKSLIRDEQNREVQLVGFALFVSLAIMSLSPHVQSRFLVPYAALFLYVAKGTYSHKRWSAYFLVSLVIAFAGIFINRLAPYPLPPVPVVQKINPL